MDGGKGEEGRMCNGLKVIIKTDEASNDDGK